MNQVTKSAAGVAAQFLYALAGNAKSAGRSRPAGTLGKALSASVTETVIPFDPRFEILLQNMAIAYDIPVEDLDISVDFTDPAGAFDGFGLYVGETRVLVEQTLELFQFRLRVLSSSCAGSTLYDGFKASLPKKPETVAETVAVPVAVEG